MSITLICMRLANMAKVHPQMIVRTCSRCNHQVGVFPSGQQAIASHGGETNATLICEICQPSTAGIPVAPGALDDAYEAVPAGSDKTKN